jgi:hypothetical protein
LAFLTIPAAEPTNNLAELNAPPTPTGNVPGRYQLVPGRLDTATGPVYGVWRIDTMTGQTWWGQEHKWPGLNVLGWEPMDEDPSGFYLRFKSSVPGTKTGPTIQTPNKIE